MQNTSGNFLGIDTALGETGIALWRDGKVAASFHAVSREHQASLLMARIEQVMAEAGVGYDALQGIAVCVGPGGFTSIRVGLAAARGIGFAGGIPVQGYSTLHLMAYGCGKQDVTAILPAGRGQVFFQHGEDAPRLLERSALPPLGTVVTTLEEVEAAQRITHDVSRNAPLLVEMLACGVPGLPATPLYIKPPDATPQQSLLERLQSCQPS